MLSPFHIKLTTKLKTVDLNDYSTLDSIKVFVGKNKGENIIVSDNKVSFKSGIFGWTWDTFSQLDKGTFVLNKNELMFEFHITRAYILFGLLFTFAIYKSESLVPILLFLILMVLNYITAHSRYKKLLENLAKELDRKNKSIDT